MNIQISKPTATNKHASLYQSWVTFNSIAHNMQTLLPRNTLIENILFWPVRLIKCGIHRNVNDSNLNNILICFRVVARSFWANFSNSSLELINSLLGKSSYTADMKHCRKSKDYSEKQSCVCLVNVLKSTLRSASICVQCDASHSCPYYKMHSAPKAVSIQLVQIS